MFRSGAGSKSRLSGSIDDLNISLYRIDRGDVIRSGRGIFERLLHGHHFPDQGQVVPAQGGVARVDALREAGHVPRGEGRERLLVLLQLIGHRDAGSVGA